MSAVGFGVVESGLNKDDLLWKANRKDQHWDNEILLLKKALCRTSQRLIYLENFLKIKFQGEFANGKGNNVVPVPFIFVDSSASAAPKHNTTHTPTPTGPTTLLSNDVPPAAAEVEINSVDVTTKFEVADDPSSPFSHDDGNDDVEYGDDADPDYTNEEHLASPPSKKIKQDQVEKDDHEAQKWLLGGDDYHEQSDEGGDEDDSLSVGDKTDGLKCRICQREFSGKHAKESLRRHLDLHSKVQKFKCSYCSKLFFHRRTKNAHEMNIHKKGGAPRVKSEAASSTVVTCDICEKKFVGYYAKDNLRRHKDIHSEKPKYKCKFCDLEFFQTRPLNSHIAKIHTKTEKHPELFLKLTCPVCKKEFLGLKAKINLRVHMDIHSETKKYKCKHCNKAFNTRRPLRSHIQRMHERDKHQIHKCNFCDKKFVCKGERKTHEMVHTGEKPFSCDLCDYASTERYAVNRHKEAMHEPKKHLCVTCGKTFSTNINLRSHQKRHELEGPDGKILKTVFCEICSKAFADLRGQKLHMRKMHGIGGQAGRGRPVVTPDESNSTPLKIS